jgi:Fic/DOC family
MILFELFRNEAHPVYQTLEVENGGRQYDFMRSLIEAAIATNKIFLSQHIIKMLNFHAIACLHTNAGEYRPCHVTVGTHTPPSHWQIVAMMDDFINEVNKNWESTDPVLLAAYIYWRINYIHPFINGNGRTARVAAFYVLCLKIGGLMQGDPALPALLKREKPACCVALQVAHDAYNNSGSTNLGPLHKIFADLIAEQLASVANSLSTGGTQDAPVPQPQP